MPETSHRAYRSGSQGAVLAGWVLVIVRALQAEGFALETIIEQADIDPLLLRNGRNRYGQEDVSRLWNVAKVMTRDPVFGLAVARQVRPAAVCPLLPAYFRCRYDNACASGGGGGFRVPF